MKSKIFTLIALTSLMLFQCNDSQDPNLLYLLALPGSATSEDPEPQNPATDYTVELGDVEGSDDFVFHTTKTIDLFVQVVEYVNPVSNVMVQVTDINNGNRVLYRAVTNGSGSVSGNFTIKTSTAEVALLVNINGETLHFIVNISNVQVIRRNIFITAKVTPTQAPVVDSDQDRIPDEFDQFPNDPTRATTIKIPEDSWYTIAFEDLFPKKGDADFNDYVVRVSHEEDLNADGEVVRIRGKYQHVARGAGYTHKLKLNINENLIGSYAVKLTGSGFACEQKEILLTDINMQNLEIYPGCKSNQTIVNANSKEGETFAPGMSSDWEIILNEATNKTVLGSAPYDLYLYVENTKKEIHFAGKYKDENDKDIYLDSDGFPWALSIPDSWKWPYEKKKINLGYELFKPWYESAGQEYTNWYLYPTEAFVFTN